VAKKFADTPIRIVGSGQASDTLALHNRRDLTTLDATVHAGRAAFAQAGIEPRAVDVAEVHDCFTIGEILAIEDLGFVEKGQGGPATEEGMTALGSSLPINTSGGLKACGHPVGATGIKQAYEIALQLRGEAGRRQVDEAEIGLTHNVGGSGGTALVHIFSR
jgi:acetyl-CoA C-acetyltransferase